jgi:riboflavin kinase/FMN adenylyltransferase
VSVLEPSATDLAQATVAGQRHAAAISVGSNPTFAGDSVTVEAFLLDFSADLYDQTIDLSFTRYLRDQQRYAGVPQLVRQLQRDVAATRTYAQEA